MLKYYMQPVCELSELCNLTMSNLFLEDHLVKVMGKGSKEHNPNQRYSTP